jgi:tetratricopeptide (TPR) repeat protein
MESTSRQNLTRLRQLLTRHFDSEELRTLCFDLGIDYEDLPSEGRAGKARELLVYLERRDRISELVELGKQLRPDISWVDIDEPRERERRLLAQAEDRTNVERALEKLRQLSRTQEDYDDALLLFERGIEGAQRAGEHTEGAAALNYVASSYQTRGYLHQALECYQASLAIWRDSGDRSGEARTLNRIGDIYQYQGEMEEARQYFEQSLHIIRELGDRVREAEALQNLGSLLRTTGEWKAALTILTQSEGVWRELEDKTGLFTALNNKGLTLASLGDVQAARQEFEKALALSQETDSIVDEATVLANLGSIAVQIADWEAAEGFYNQALHINERLNDLAGMLTTLTNLGSVYTNQKRWDQALEFYQRGLTIARRTGDQATEATALGNIGDVLVAKGDLDEALVVYQQILDVQESLGDRVGYARTQDSISAIYRQREEAQRPLSLVISEAQRFFQAAGFQLGTTGEPESFVCQPATPFWQTKIKHDVYTNVLVDCPLDGDTVLSIRDAAQTVSGDIEHAFTLVNQVVQDDAWLQIAALRAVNFDVIPIPLTLLAESKTANKPAAERLALQKHLRRFLGKGYDPYNVRDPVSDVLNFFGREALARELIDDHLIAGQPVGLFGLRKMGKSSLMRYMQRLMPCPTAWLDLQAGVDLTALYERMLRAWNNDAQARFNTDLGLEDAKLNSDDSSSHFFQLTQDALDKLTTQIHDARLALFLDEIELITPPADAAGPVLERYLFLMRNLRGLVQEDERVSLMVAGVDPSVTRVNWWGGEQNPFYKLLQEVYLPPLLEDDCILMIRNIGSQVELSYDDDAEDCVAQASGGHPFLARQLCSLAYEQRNQHPGKVPLKSITEAANRFLFDPQYATFVNRTGLWGEVSNAKLWGEQAAHANQETLIALAKSPDPLTESDLMDKLDSASHRSAFFALRQLHVIRPVQDSPAPSDPHYAITFGLFRSWLRRVQLGLKE